MAFSDVRKELDCSICLNIYTNPVTLRCGHNFCRECIERVLDAQRGGEEYFCPECREEFQERPELIRNITLRNIVESLQSTEPEKKEEKQIFCTQCIHSPVPAVKSCLLCEVSLCDDHLKVHSKSSQHVLSDLTTPQKNRKCSVHEKILEYYCTEDSACLCGSCRLHGDHQEHQVEALEEASEKRKENLTNALQKLVKKKKEMEESLKILLKYKRTVQDSADGVTKKVTAIFRDIRKQLDLLERRVMNEISRQADNLSFPVSDLIQDLEIKKDELSRKICHMEEICNLTDPLTLLQESDTGDLCDTEDGDEEDKERRNKLLHGGDLDLTGISRLLHTGLYDIVTGINKGTNIPETAEITLDENTAHNNLYISDKGKTACRVVANLNRFQSAMRFNAMSEPQVLSSQSFSSGRHYWDVDVGGSSHCRVGMCYPSIDRTLKYTEIGGNSVSWCLEIQSNQLLVKHGYNSTTLAGNLSATKVRINLDYEAGQISFYELGLPIRHLHTFICAFTEPLHAALYVKEGCIKICKGNQKV